MNFNCDHRCRLWYLALFYFLNVQSISLGNEGRNEIRQFNPDYNSVVHLWKRESEDKVLFDNSLLNTKECEGVKQICPHLTGNSDNLDVLLCVNKVHD